MRLKASWRFLLSRLSTSRFQVLPGLAYDDFKEKANKRLLTPWNIQLTSKHRGSLSSPLCHAQTSRKRHRVTVETRTSGGKTYQAQHKKTRSHKIQHLEAIAELCQCKSTYHQSSGRNPPILEEATRLNGSRYVGELKLFKIFKGTCQPGRRKMDG
jgi:hypothetical protein